MFNFLLLRQNNFNFFLEDPVLFCGTLRVNLDPFETHTDEQLWNALERANLKEFVENCDQKLEFEITEGGENLR